MSNFMQIKNQTETTADIHFYGDIVNDSWDSYWEDESRCPNDIKTALDEVQGKDLNIYINSGGGSVFGGMAIYNMLKRYNGHKTVYVDGLAGSIASVIALAGDRVVIPSTAYMMIHKPWAGAWGNADDMRKMADSLDRIQDGIINVYKEHLKDGVDIQEIIDMVNAETWLTGDQASNYFNIEVSETDAINYADIKAFNYKNVPKNLIKDDPQPQEPSEIELAAVPESEENPNNQAEIEMMNKEIDLYLI